LLDCTVTLCAVQLRAKQRGYPMMHCVALAPEGANLLGRQHPITTALWRHGLEPGSRIRIDPLTIEREVEHLLHKRQHAIGHNRGANLFLAIVCRTLAEPTLGDALDETADVTARDLLHLPIAPRRQKVEVDLAFVLPPRPLAGAPVGANLFRPLAHVDLRKLVERLG